MENFREIPPFEINENIIKLIGSDWMLISAGTKDHYNMMTASWGSMGFLWNMPVSFVFVRPQRYTYEFTEKHATYTLSFFEAKHKHILEYCGKYSGRDFNKAKEADITPITSKSGNIGYAEASLIIECTKLYADDLQEHKFLIPEVDKKIYPQKDYHRMYIGRMDHVWARK